MFLFLDDLNFEDIEEFLQTASTCLEQAKDCFTQTNNWLNNVIVESNLGVVHRTWAHAIKNSILKLAPQNKPQLMTEDEQKMHEKALGKSNFNFKISPLD